LNKDIKHLSDLPQLLYAANNHTVLLIFQVMGVLGKDSAI